MKKLDVAIIGAGSGGLSARREVEKKTQNYLVFDHGKLGTTCARVGCMPSKVLIQTANEFHRRHKLKEQGISGAEVLTLNDKDVMSHVRALRDRFVRGVLGGMSDWRETHFVPEKVTFIDENTFMAGEKKYTADRIILATGSKPFTPSVYQGVKEKTITTDEFFELERLPRRIAIVGIGVIGLELGQALTRLGVEVTFFARRKVFAGISDPEINKYIASKYEQELNIVYDNVENTYRDGDHGHITTTSNNYEVDLVLMCSGRRPVLSNMGLESLGIVDRLEFDKSRFQLLRHPHIFIAGDITGEKQILHEASDEGKIAGFNAVNEGVPFKTRTPLAITFTDPNIAVIGQSFGELQDKNIKFETGEVSFEGQGRSIIKLKEIGLLHIYGEQDTGKLLGAELFAPNGEHLAHLIAWLIQQDLTVVDALSMPFYHPVVEEGLRTALRDLQKKCNIETLLEVKVQ